MRHKKKQVRTPGRVLILALLIVLFSASTSSEFVARKDCIYYVDLYLKQFTNLEFEEVMATVKKESEFKPHLKCKEKTVRDISYGPMQVRGKTARESLGYTGDLDDLCTWEKGLYYGMMYMNDCKASARKISNDPATVRRHMWARYNGGTYYYTQNKKGEWIYINEGYIQACERDFNTLSIYGGTCSTCRTVVSLN